MLSLSPTQSIALNRGMALFNATGLRFAVELPDLTTVGPLPVPKEVPSAPAKRTRTRLPSLEPRYQFQSRVDALLPGQRLTILTDSEADARQLISNMSARGFARFGRKNTLAARRGLLVELARVA